MQTIDTQFFTYHHSGNDLHLRTAAGIVAIGKDQKDLQEAAKKLRRHQKIRVSGTYEHSKTLSTQVIAAQSLVVVD